MIKTCNCGMTTVNRQQGIFQKLNLCWSTWLSRKEKTFILKFGCGGGWDGEPWDF